MFMPDVAVSGALFVIARSATRRAVVVATEALLVALASSVRLVAVTVAVLAIGPVAAGLMWTTIVKVWVALRASAPTLQVTVPAVLVHPALAETKLTWTGSTSVTVPPLEVEGPLLVTVMVKVWAASAASVPTLQLTVPAVVVQPALAETRLTWTGSTSVTVPPLEVEGPLLVTVRE